MNDETLQEALDYCLANPDELEMEELLNKFPESREELVPLLALCGLISEAVPPVPQERKDAMKGRILNAAMARQQAMAAPSNGHQEGAVAATLPVVMAEPEPSVPSARPTQPVRLPGKVKVEDARPRRGFILDWLKRPSFAAAFATLLLAIVWALSASSMPDSPFYTVKLLGESIAVNIQSSPEGKALKHNELANIRLLEIEEMERRGKLAQAGRAFSDYAEHLRASRDILSDTQFTEQQRSRLAQALYATTTIGEIELSDLEDSLSSLPPPVRESLSETKQLQEEVRDYSEGVLEDLGVAPLTTLPTETQDRLRQTPGPDATALAPSMPGGGQAGATATGAMGAAGATSSPTSPGASSQGAATATSRAAGNDEPDRTATYIAGNPASSATGSATRTNTASVTATQTGVLAATTATPTHTAGREATATATARSEVSPLVSTPTSTARPRNGATVTPPRGKPTETGRPETTRTPGRPPTHTPGPEKTKTKKPEDTATVTALPTYTFTPTGTRVPPTETPVPTSTLVPTATPTEEDKDKKPTNTPKPRELPTDTAEPTLEPTLAPTEEPSGEPRPVSVCAVDVTGVSVGCGSGNCVEWSAHLVNKATEPVEISWVAEMQVEVAGVAPMTYSESGATLVRPGEESITGTFCESLPELTRRVRVTVRTDTGAASCDSRKQDSIEPCESDERNEPKITKEPEPTETPKPTKEPEPTVTPKPTKEPESTRKPEPTGEPERTREPEPTRESEPTREPVLTEIPLPTIPLIPTKTPKR